MIETLLKAFDAAHVEVLIVTLPGAVIRDASSTLLAKWNCQRTDVIGKTILKFGSGPISAKMAPTANASDANLEVSYSPPLGSRIDSTFRTLTVANGQGSDLILIGQANSAEHLASSLVNERRLNLALKSGGYALWDHDFETGDTYNSPEMVLIFGGRLGEKSLSYHTFNALVHPDDRALTIDEKIKASPFGTDVFQTRYRVKSANGQYAWIECLAGLVRDPATGKPKKCVGLCRNIDHEMLTLDRLKNSELMLKRTQAVSHIGSFKLRLESNVSRLTTELAAMIGLADAMIHPNLDTFIKMIEPGDREKFVEGLELAKLGKQVKNIEISVRSKTGNVEWFVVTIEPERGTNGEIENIFGACQLVTERRALEDKYHQAQKMEAVGQLTGGIAHDFNNLLMVVMGNLQLVEHLVAGDERALKRIRAAITAADKGSDLTRRMLAFSRQQTLQNREIEVGELLDSMKDMLQQAITANVELQVLPSENLWSIKADRTMLETAILNLAINARDAMAPKGGKLIVETANRVLDKTFAAATEDLTPGEYVQISVTDTGSGIAPENIAKVFQPFFTTKGPEAGSGLGLSMIYGFVKQSGGHVKIYSEVGVGTSVKLYLPKSKTLPVAAGVLEKTPHAHAELLPAQAIQAKSPAMPARKLKVLVVEDSSPVREVAAAMIDEMGFDAITASNGHEGLQAIKDMPDIDLVLSDVIMAGGMTGPELALKAMQVRPDLKILFMSGYAPGSVRQMQDLPDTIELVNKPFTRGDLTEKVRRAIAAPVAA